MAFNYNLIDKSRGKPISEEEYRILKRRYEYDKNPVIISSSSHEKFMEWDHEIITIQAVYDGP